MNTSSTESTNEDRAGEEFLGGSLVGVLTGLLIGSVGTMTVTAMIDEKPAGPPVPVKVVSVEHSPYIGYGRTIMQSIESGVRYAKKGEWGESGDEFTAPSEAWLEDRE